MRRFGLEFGLVTAMLGMSSAGYAADHDAVVTGVVRDGRGVPQMGALVQILSSSNSAVRVTTFTDLQGRYLVQSLLPGRYGIRVSAALFLPVSRDLRLQPDHRSVVNLTLSGLLDTSTWLPVRSKAVNEPSDDWNWTLRSTAGRPILKLDEDGDVVAGGASEGKVGGPAMRVRGTVRSASKRFGGGSAEVGVAGGSLRRSGAEIAFESALGQRRGVDAAVSLSTRLERPLGPAGSVVTRVSYTSHPEIREGAGGAGLRVVRVSSAERFQLGDAAEVEAGSRVEAIRGAATAIVAQPFVRVSAHPSTSWTVTYSLASSPAMQDFEDVAGPDRELPVVFEAGGRGETERGRHQEISVAHRKGATLLEVAYYADALDRIALTGVEGGSGGDAGAIAELEAEESHLLVDRSNGSFRALSNGYRGDGVNVLLTRRIGAHAGLAVQYANGPALASGVLSRAAGAGGLPVVKVRRAEAATVSVKGMIAKTGTRAQASYRWEPDLLVTAVDPYDMLSGAGYLGFHVRQPLSLEGLLPDGFEVRVDGTNVLGQGYQLVRGRSGPPLYLAASPMSLQAGVSFTF